MSDKDYIQRLLSDPTLVPEKAWALAMQSKYPTFVTPSLLRLKRAELSEQERKELMQFVVVRSSNRRMLSIALNCNVEAVSSLLSPMTAMQSRRTTTEHSTEATIDTFLSNYGSTSQSEITAIENAIFNPTAEYALTLDDGEEEESRQDTSSIPDFDESAFRHSIQASINAATPANTEEPTATEQEETEPTGITLAEGKELPKESEETEDTDTVRPAKARTAKSLTESLAIAYIKQKKYKQAYDMLCAIRDNAQGENPNIDDQIRFLSLLIKYCQ